MSCRPVLMITKNGRRVESLLFNRLYDRYEDKEAALVEYAYIHTEEFKKHFGDWTDKDFDPNLLDDNGEPSQKAIGLDHADPITREELSPEYQKIVQNLELRIKSLNRITYKKEQSLARSERDSVVDDIRGQIAEILEDASTDTVARTAMKQLAWVKQIFYKKDHTAGELLEAMHTMHVWNGIRGILYDKEAESISTKIQEVEAELANLEPIRQLKFGQLILKEAPGLSKEDMEILIAPSTFFAWSVDLGSMADNLAQHLATILKDAARNSEKKIKQDIAKIEEERKALESYASTAGGMKAVQDLFFQKDADGNDTHRLVDRYSQAFYTERGKATHRATSAIEEAKTTLTGAAKTKAIQKANKDLRAWIKANQVHIDTSIFFGEHQNDKTKATEKAELVKEIGEEAFNELLKDAEDKYEEYLLEKQTYEDSLEDNPDKETLLGNWIGDNSPDVYFYESKGLVGADGYTNTKGYRHTVYAPKKSVNKGAWYDSNFSKIEKTPALKRFYDFIKKDLAEKKSYLSDYDKRNLKTNYLPIVNQDLVERFREQGMIGAASFLSESGIKMLTSGVLGDYSNTEKDSSGKPIPRVGIKYLHDNGGAKSKDLFKILALYTASANNYKYKSEIEPVALIIQAIFQVKKSKVTMDGKDVTDSYGNPTYNKEVGDQLRKLVEYTIEASVYDQRKNTEGVSDSKINNLSELAKKDPKVQEILARLEALKSEKGEDYSLEKKTLEKELEDIVGRNITASKIVDASIQITQAKALGWNLFTAIANLGFGVVSNMIHASGEKDFTMKEFWKATRLMMTTTQSAISVGMLDTDLSKKIRALMDEVGMITDVVDSQTGKTTKWSALSSYQMMKVGDYFIKGQTLVAMMLNTKISEGVSLWDAFDMVDGKLTWNTEKYGEQGQWAHDTVEGTNDFTKFRNKALEVSKIIHGNFDSNAPVLAKKYAMGRLLAQFKLSWMGQGIHTRFQDERFSHELGRDVKGRYRTYGKFMKEAGVFGGSLNIVTTFLRMAVRDRNALANLSPVDQENMRKNFTSVAIGLTLSAVALSLAYGLGHGDDDDDKRGVRLLVNNLNRISSDIWFYSNPATFQNLTSKVIPALSTYTDLMKAGSGLAKYMMDKDYSGEEALLRLTKALPGVGQINKFNALGKKIF